MKMSLELIIMIGPVLSKTISRKQKIDSYIIKIGGDYSIIMEIRKDYSFNMKIGGDYSIIT